MKYKDFKKGDNLVGAFRLDGEETQSFVDFAFDNKSNMHIDTRNCTFSKQEVFNFAMILLKAAGEMDDYKKK